MPPGSAVTSTQRDTWPYGAGGVSTPRRPTADRGETCAGHRGDRQHWHARRSARASPGGLDALRCLAAFYLARCSRSHACAFDTPDFVAFLPLPLALTLQRPV